MAKLIPFALLSLGACDAGVPKSKPEPVKKLVEVPAPRDAGVLVPADAAAPTPALAGAHLRLNHFDLPPQAECARTRMVLQLIDKSKHVIDELKENSTCAGACTAKEKSDAEAEVARIEELIDAEKTTPSELDYNFTGCLETGLGDIEVVRNVGGRDVALITDRYLGPHDGVYDRYELALEICGTIWVSDTFGELMAHSWPMERLSIQSDGPNEIVVQGVGESDDGGGTLLDLRMPACPGVPVQQAFDVWPMKM
ncbi:MAG TPA: hypothetical protein VL326_35725 [Kofleriaceae bacterium]|jgi:hypothetical protein|nr:hypothetical protein [Kofleriaceae bacterium]